MMWEYEDVAVEKQVSYSLTTDRHLDIIIHLSLDNCLSIA